MKITRITLAATISIASSASCYSVWKDLKTIKREIGANKIFGAQEEFVAIYNLPRTTREEKRNQKIAFDSLQHAINHKKIDLTAHAIEDLPRIFTCIQEREHSELSMDCYLLIMMWGERLQSIYTGQETLENIQKAQRHLAQLDSGAHIQDDISDETSEGDGATADEAGEPTGE